MHHDDVGLVLGGDIKLPGADGKVGIVDQDRLGVALGHSQGLDVAGLELHHAHADLTDGVGLGIGKLLFHEHLLQGGVLGADVHALEVLGLGVLLGVGGTDQQNLRGLVIAGIVVIGQVEVLGTGLGPGVAGDGHIDSAHRNGGLAGVKAHGLDLELDTNGLGNVLGQRHVKADVLVLAGLGGIDKLHGAEVGGERHGQDAGFLDDIQLGLLVRGKSGDAQAQKHGQSKCDTE